jgi:hypothetical protein
VIAKWCLSLGQHANCSEGECSCYCHLLDKREVVSRLNVMTSIPQPMKYPTLVASVPLFAGLVLKRIEDADEADDSWAASYWRGFGYLAAIREAKAAFDRGVMSVSEVRARVGVPVDESHRPPSR